MLKILRIDSDYPQKEVIKEAAQLIKEGKLVAFPTETVYGLGADASNEEAAGRIFEVKGRPRDKALSILIGRKEDLGRYVQEVPEKAPALIEKFWPGPLTLIFKASSLIPETVRGKGNTIGIRMPDSKVALGLIRTAGVPLACPSANLSGYPSPTKAEEVVKGLDGRIELLLDGGETRMGRGSTVLDLTTSPPTILREGALKKRVIAEVVGKVSDPKGSLTRKDSMNKTILFICTGNSCRSPMAEGFLKEMLSGEKGIKSDSCGIISSSFGGATPQAIKIMKEKGIDISTHRTKTISKDLIDGADLILVMEAKHRQKVQELSPEAGNKAFLLKDFARDKNNLEVKDPIGLSDEIYREVAREIKNALARALPKILEVLKESKDEGCAGK